MSPVAHTNLGASSPQNPTAAESRRRNDPRLAKLRAERRGPRDQTLSVLVTREERALVKATAKALGFRTPSAFLAYLIVNLFKVSNDPLYGCVFEADFFARLSRGLGVEYGKPYAGVLNEEFLGELSKRIDAAVETAHQDAKESSTPFSGKAPP